MCGKYSREETIQGWKLYEEIRYTKNWSSDWRFCPILTRSHPLVEFFKNSDRRNQKVDTQRKCYLSPLFFFRSEFCHWNRWQRNSSIIPVGVPTKAAGFTYWLSTLSDEYFWVHLGVPWYTRHTQGRHPRRLKRFLNRHFGEIFRHIWRNI